MFQVGPYTIKNPVVMAPMAGITDAPFRALCRHYGVELAFSEMTLANTAVWNSRKSRTRCDFSRDPEPVVVQIAGSEPQAMAEAARYQQTLGAHWIDINMGCPAKKVCRKAAGSALLADPGRVREILQAVCETVPLASLKIRTGPGPEQRNALHIAQIAEECGIRLLSIHGRTRADRFRGQAEYHTIRDVCRHTRLPVLANGDICTSDQARRVLEYTGANGVMIGRAALGQPWLLSQLTQALAGQPAPEPDWREKSACILRHMADIHAFYGEEHGVRIARKHLAWYLEALDMNALRPAFMALNSSQAQMHWLQHTFQEKVCA